MKILIVEDDDAILDGLTFCLKKKDLKLFRQSMLKRDRNSFRRESRFTYFGY